MVTILHYTNKEIRNLSIEQLSQPLKEEEGIFWIDLEAPTKDEVTQLVDLLKIDSSLLAEMHKGDRKDTPLPRLEMLPDHLFMIFNTIELDEVKQEDNNLLHFRTSQFSMFLTTNILITHHFDPIPSLKNVMQACINSPQLLEPGTKYLLSLITDTIVESYLPVIARIDMLSELYESEIFHNPGKLWMEKVLRFKKNILTIRRIGYYEREIMYRLHRSEFAMIATTEKPYFENVFNHLVRMADAMDSSRDAVSSLLDAYLSITSQNMNEVMKMLTIMSTIFLPLSVITGFYGMNLPFLPGAGSAISYIPVSLLMLGVVGFMLYFFKKRNWL